MEDAGAKEGLRQYTTGKRGFPHIGNQPRRHEFLPLLTFYNLYGLTMVLIDLAAEYWAVIFKLISPSDPKL